VEGTTQIVHERAGSRNFLWGFLSVVCAVVLVRGHLGAQTSAGRITVDLIAGILLGLCVFAWVWFNRHPASLAISSDAIVHHHRGQSQGTRLPHTGHLFVSRTMVSGKHPVAFLKVVGSQEAISLGNFNLAEIQQASLAAGWQWGERPHPAAGG